MEYTSLSVFDAGQEASDLISKIKVALRFFTQPFGQAGF